MSVVSEIFTLMAEDDEDQSDRLERLYNEADEKGKELIDDALICVCGYSMSSLKERAS